MIGDNFHKNTISDGYLGNIELDAKILERADSFVELPLQTSI